MKINDLSYNATGARYGYNSQEQSTELNSDGNHTTAEFWEYDARSARRWNLDPVDQISKSNYSTFANNPISYNDLNGDKAKVINKEFENRPYVAYTNTFDLNHVENQLNTSIKILEDPKSRHYAPKLANFIKNYTIPVVMAEGISSHGQTYDDYISINMKLYRRDVIDKTQNYLEKTFIHEVIHFKSRNNGEFQVRAAIIRLGLGSKKEYLNLLENKFKYAIENMPEEFKQYFELDKNNEPIKLIKEKTNEFFESLYKYGDKIINEDSEPKTDS